MTLNLILVYLFSLLITMPLQARNPAVLNTEFKEMLDSLKVCKNYKKYYPYKEGLEKVLKGIDVTKIKDYEYSSIFDSGFLHFSYVDDCREITTNFIINGITWVACKKPSSMAYG